jgi:hypothetical protein
MQHGDWGASETTMVIVRVTVQRLLMESCCGQFC